MKIMVLVMIFNSFWLPLSWWVLDLHQILVAPFVVGSRSSSVFGCPFRGRFCRPLEDHLFRGFFPVETIGFLENHMHLCDIRSYLWSSVLSASLG